MSYRCDECKEVVSPNVSQRRITTHVREKKWGSGTEIAKEVIVCPDCYFKFSVESLNQ